MQIEERNIAVPWGHIATRLWGNPSDQHVLVIHGILDNCGAFNRLLRLLPKNFYYIAIDLPGHGRSSHWPKGALYNTLDNLLAYRAVADYFKNKKFIVIGHSYGGQLAFIYTLLYPERVIKLCMLDTLFLYPHRTSVLKNNLVTLHDEYFKMMEKFEKRNPPEYAYEEALDKVMHNRRYGDISQDAAEEVLKRMMVELPNGKIRFGTDQRIKLFFNPVWDFRYITEFIKKDPVKCPVLIILASESEAQLVYFRPIVKLFKNYKNIKIKMVEGNHDVHNEHPERMAPLIEKFMLFPKSKL